MRTYLDVTFDFRRDTPSGKDPDSHSRTLRRYHELLWSKALPSGRCFRLEQGVSGHYLYHRSCLGEFSLSSDSAIPTFRWNSRIRKIVPEGELQAFFELGYTIGGMMVFPGKQVDKQWTINQAKGCNHFIRDRFDLTLECIRRHYRGEDSPLATVLARYAGFFGLFRDFRGYVEFFLLQDLVSSDFCRVRTFTDFDCFRAPSIPQSLADYRLYSAAACEFISARNRRILGLGLPFAGPDETPWQVDPSGSSLMGAAAL